MAFGIFLFCLPPLLSLLPQPQPPKGSCFRSSLIRIGAGGGSKRRRSNQHSAVCVCVQYYVEKEMHSSPSLLAPSHLVFTAQLGSFPREAIERRGRERERWQKGGGEGDEGKKEGLFASFMKQKKGFFLPQIFAKRKFMLVLFSQNFVKKKVGERKGLFDVESGGGSL